MLIASLRLGFSLATLVASLHVAAEPRFWTLTGVQFDDGAVATGYFSYDDATGTEGPGYERPRAGTDAHIPVGDRAWRRQPVEVKRKSGKVWVKRVKTKTISLDLGLVRRILNLAARKWRDEHGLTWLETAPLISMLKVRDARPPYPLSWAEQRLLLPELPAHRAEVCLFLLNCGLRSESEAVRLDWRGEVQMPELGSSVFIVPGDSRKNEQDHVCVLNSVARSIVERCRGKHRSAVFTFRGRPLASVNNTPWLNARERAVAKYEERMGEPPPEGFRTLHVHDLRHTVGRRLRAAGVSLETRQAILGHKSGSITTHYSAAELRELLEAMELIATDNSRESHALTLLKRKAG